MSEVATEPTVKVTYIGPKKVMHVPFPCPCVSLSESETTITFEKNKPVDLIVRYAEQLAKQAKDVFKFKGLVPEVVKYQEAEEGA